MFNEKAGREPRVAQGEHPIHLVERLYPDPGGGCQVAPVCSW
jgi:hypothetical protein